MKHSATGLAPKDARKLSNKSKVKRRLNMNAKRNRVYADLSVGYEDTFFRERKPNEKKELAILAKMFVQ